MTTKDLLGWTESFEASIRDNLYLWDAVRRLAKQQGEIFLLFAESLPHDSSHEATFRRIQTARTNLSTIRTEVKELGVQRVFNQIAATTASLSKLQLARSSQATKPLEGLRTLIGEFGQAYEQFINAQGLPETAILLSVAQKTAAAFDAAVDCINFAKENLKLEPEGIPVEGARIEIYLSARSEFQQFLEKATALEEIYEEVCALLDISSSQEPLKIVKIESGSLWAWLQGNPKAAGVIGGLIASFAHYIYRNFTAEGKLSTIPKNLEQIHSVLHLSDELKKRGIPTEGLDERIGKASVKIASQLEKLLEGEEQIEVNGEVLPLNPSQQQKLIAAKQVKLIAERSPGESEPQK